VSYPGRGRECARRGPALARSCNKDLSRLDPARSTFRRLEVSCPLPVSASSLSCVAGAGRSPPGPRLTASPPAGLRISHPKLIQSLWADVYKKQRVLPADGWMEG
jgi:hypothetical protein